MKDRKCKKCSSYIPFYKKVDNKVRNLSHRVYCLECSPFGSHNTRKLGNLSLDESRAIRKLERNKKSVIRVKLSRKRVIKKAIRYKGGKCVICGYNRCVGALEFHHIDPKEKTFTIRGSGMIMNWEKLKVELDKCLLVCANCHREISSGIGISNNFLYGNRTKSGNH